MIFNECTNIWNILAVLVDPQGLEFLQVLEVPEEAEEHLSTTV